MDPLVVFAIALTVFVLFVLMTAYMLKSAISFRSETAGIVTARKDDTGQAVTKDDEEPARLRKKKGP
jgi:hypothetical protein